MKILTAYSTMNAVNATKVRFFAVCVQGKEKKMSVRVRCGFSEGIELSTINFFYETLAFPKKMYYLCAFLYNAVFCPNDVERCAKNIFELLQTTINRDY